MSYNDRSPLLKKLLGLALVAAVIGSVVLVVQSYYNKLSPEVRATVLSDRAGLGMIPDAAVSLRGVNVGRVRGVELRGDKAAITVGFEPDKIKFIPADVSAEITQPTLFGAKYIDLVTPAQPTSARLAEGQTIPTTAQVTEGNTVLDHLASVLTKVDVPKLNSGLGALSTALQGRGDKLGNVIVQVDTYLKDFNPSLPKLNDDLASLADVTNIYADFVPDLVSTLDNVAVTTGTVVDRKDELRTLFHDTVESADAARKLLEDNRKDLHRALSLLDPVTGLLAAYAPGFPCLFATTNQYRIDFENLVGGVVPGVRTLSEFLPASDGYRYPRDLPKVGAIRTPPSCFGGPIDPADIPTPRVRFDDGWGGFTTTDALTLDIPRPMPIPTALPNMARAPKLPLANEVVPPTMKLPVVGSNEDKEKPQLPVIPEKVLGDGLPGIGGGR